MGKLFFIDLIKNGELNRVFYLIDKIISVDDFQDNILHGIDIKHQLIILLSRFNELEKKSKAGTIRYEEESIERNKIRSSMLNLLSEIPDKIFTHASENENEEIALTGNYTKHYETIKLQYKDPFDRRLAAEYYHIRSYCESNDKISFRVLEEAKKSNLPIKYAISIEINSITGIDGDYYPVFSKKHELQIVLPQDYPTSRPKLWMTTPVWHPNIKYEGVYKGRISVETKSMQKSHLEILPNYNHLDYYIHRVCLLLQYKDYIAEPVPPFPEDAMVAEWVRSFGEPMNIINKDKNIYTDDIYLRTYINEYKIEFNAFNVDKYFPNDRLGCPVCGLNITESEKVVRNCVHVMHEECWKRNNKNCSVCMFLGK